MDLLNRDLFCKKEDVPTEFIHFHKIRTLINGSQAMEGQQVYFRVVDTPPLAYLPHQENWKVNILHIIKILQQKLRRFTINI